MDYSKDLCLIHFIRNLQDKGILLEKRYITLYDIIKKANNSKEDIQNFSKDYINKIEKLDDYRKEKKPKELDYDNIEAISMKKFINNTYLNENNLTIEKIRNLYKGRI